MYKVVVADDEQIALNYICSIVKKKCPEYEIVATAEDGRDALEKVEAYRPDLVITDIKMPLISGIQLASEIQKKYPDTHTVIVSGYSDFEYARSAIQAGVCDYILKPVVPSEMRKILEKISRELGRKKYERCTHVIKKLCRNAECDMEMVRQFFTYDRYYCAIIRRNGLPKRFGTGRAEETFSEINETYTVYGRDEMEQLYIIPEILLNRNSISAYIVALSQKMHLDTDYMTIVYYRKSCSPEEIHHHIKKLYHTLDAVSVVGENQMIALNDDDQKVEIMYDQKSILDVMNHLEYLLKNEKYSQFRKETERLYIQWVYEKKPQLWMEYMTRQILYMMNKYGENSLSASECEYMLEDAFFYAVTLEELLGSLYEIMFQSIKKEAGDAKIDSPEFADSIERYMQEHLAENLSLQNVSRKFGISQTYLGKLVRKYKDESFGHYLTGIRMKKATELMQDCPQLYIKDIAQMVGYNDQFYFSRIFRSYMGVCPSDYIDNIAEVIHERSKEN